MAEGLAEQVLAAARARGLRIGTAESCTGGLIAAALTEVPGSSHAFTRGFVTYSNAAKIEELGVRAKTLEAHGAVSEEVAGEMAAGVLARGDVEISLSTTGIAGPGASHHKPEGRVCFALARKAGTVRTWTCDFGALGRAQVRKISVETGLRALLEALA